MNFIILRKHWNVLENLNFTDNLCAEATNIASYACRGDSGSGVIANDKELSPEY